MIHEMRLRPEPFDRIVNGMKKIEFRLWDEKRKLVKPGDDIIFTNMKTGKIIVTGVKEVYRATTFEQLKELLVQKKVIDDSDFDPLKMQDYYSRKEEEKYGVVGILIFLK
ncbi:MAG: ASCH domain-containing protein [Lachnospiraceae bacterium]